MGGKSTKTLDMKFKNMIYQNQIPYNPHQVLLGKQKKNLQKGRGIHIATILNTLQSSSHV